VSEIHNSHTLQLHCKIGIKKYDYPENFRLHVLFAPDDADHVDE